VAVAEHDHAYKRFFSHPEMVADLLRGFVHEDWVQDLDFSTLERVSGSFVTRDRRSRENDVLWRLRWEGDRWLYVYLLIEFQSTVDPFMALRLMVYLGLLYQDLIRHHQLTVTGKLPPVLPVVLYNGHAPWGGARAVSELIEPVPGGLEHYRPELRYCLLDEMRMADSELESLRNVAAALFRLEKGRGPEDIERVVAALIDWLQGPEQAELRRSFTDWSVADLIPGRVPGASIPKLKDLQEVRSMLAELDWTKRWKQEGIEEGLQKGLKRGRKEGLEKGLEMARGVLLHALERRFGPVPKSIRKQVEAIVSIEEITELSCRVGEASSLSDLSLG
jgi:predicted transposase/invertase (TIGR01784 family)